MRITTFLLALFACLSSVALAAAPINTQFLQHRTKTTLLGEFSFPAPGGWLNITTDEVFASLPKNFSEQLYHFRFALWVAQTAQSLDEDPVCEQEDWRNPVAPVAALHSLLSPMWWRSHTLSYRVPKAGAYFVYLSNCESVAAVSLISSLAYSGGAHVANSAAPAAAVDSLRGPPRVYHKVDYSVPPAIAVSVLAALPLLAWCAYLLIRARASAGKPQALLALSMAVKVAALSVGAQMIASAHGYGIFADQAAFRVTLGPLSVALGVLSAAALLPILLAGALLFSTLAPTLPSAVTRTAYFLLAVAAVSAAGSALTLTHEYAATSASGATAPAATYPTPGVSLQLAFALTAFTAVAVTVILATITAHTYTRAAELASPAATAAASAAAGPASPSSVASTASTAAALSPNAVASDVYDDDDNDADDLETSRTAAGAGFGAGSARGPGPKRRKLAAAVTAVTAAAAARAAASARRHGVSPAVAAARLRGFSVVFAGAVLPAATAALADQLYLRAGPAAATQRVVVGGAVALASFAMSCFVLWPSGKHQYSSLGVAAGLGAMGAGAGAGAGAAGGYDEFEEDEDYEYNNAHNESTVSNGSIAVKRSGNNADDGMSLEMTTMAHSSSSSNGNNANGHLARAASGHSAGNGSGGSGNDNAGHGPNHGADASELQMYAVAAPAPANDDDISLTDA